MSIDIFKKFAPYIFALAIIPAFVEVLHARQVSPVSDPDSIQAASDTVLVTPPQKRSDLDAPITYSAHSIENLVEQRITILTGTAVVKFKTATLEAGRITVDWNKNLL